MCVVCRARPRTSLLSLEVAGAYLMCGVWKRMHVRGVCVGCVGCTPGSNNRIVLLVSPPLPPPLPPRYDLLSGVRQGLLRDLECLYDVREQREKLGGVFATLKDGGTDQPMFRSKSWGCMELGRQVWELPELCTLSERQYVRLEEGEVRGKRREEGETRQRGEETIRRKRSVNEKNGVANVCVCLVRVYMYEPCVCVLWKDSTFLSNTHVPSLAVCRCRGSS